MVSRFLGQQVSIGFCEVTRFAQQVVLHNRLYARTDSSSNVLPRLLSSRDQEVLYRGSSNTMRKCLGLMLVIVVRRTNRSSDVLPRSARLLGLMIRRFCMKVAFQTLSSVCLAFMRINSGLGVNNGEKRKKYCKGLSSIM